MRYAGARFLAPLALVAAFLATRLSHLLSLPVFIDEAIYVQQSRMALLLNDFSAGRESGKWLAIQSYALWMRLTDSGLWSARTLAVCLGLLTMTTLYADAYLSSSSNRIARATLAACAYIALPLAVFYDRQALTEQFLVPLTALLVMCSFGFARTRHWAYVTGACIALALAPLFKLSGLILAPIPLLMLLVTDRGALREWRMTVPYSMTATLVIALTYVESRRVPDAARSLTTPGSELGLASRFVQNIFDSSEMLWRMLTPPFVVLLILGIGLALVVCAESSGRRRLLAAVVVWLWLQGSCSLLFGIAYPRYFVPAVVPICIAFSEAAMINWEASKRHGNGYLPGMTGVATVIALVVASAYSSLLIISPSRFPLHPIDARQYVTGWSSGYGLREALSTIREIAGDHPDGILLLRQPTTDVPLWGLDLCIEELGDRVSVSTLTLWEPGTAKAEIAGVLDEGKPVYLLVNTAESSPTDGVVLESVRAGFDVDQVAHFERPGRNPGLAIWAIAGTAVQPTDNP